MGDRISGWEAKVADLHEAATTAAWCREALGPSLRVRDWRQLNAAFFAALQLEKWAMFIILCLIVIVAAFNIISTLSMKVMEKTKDIGVLKALGATDGTVLRVFLLEGLSIGALGTLVGLVPGDRILYGGRPLPTVSWSGGDVQHEPPAVQDGSFGSGVGLRSVASD